MPIKDVVVTLLSDLEDFGAAALSPKEGKIVASESVPSRLRSHNLGPLFFNERFNQTNDKRCIMAA
jgi:hypothetical protein